MSHKIEFEKQLDISSCGVACLKMISSFHGKKYPLEYLQALIPAGKDGVSLLSISKAAESIGFKTVGGSFYLNDLVETIHLPCILHWNQNHFVIYQYINTI